MAVVLRLRINPQVLDSCVAAAIFALSVIASRLTYLGWPTFDTTAYILTACVTFPLAVRRLYPFTVLIVSSAAYGLYLALGDQPAFSYWAPVLAFYTVAGVHPTRYTAVAALLPTGLMYWSSITVPQLPVEAAIAQAVIVPAIAWVFGENVRKLRAATARLREEQRERTIVAIVDERARIARELHDVVAHHMSVISVQAGLAGYVFTSDPPTAQGALDTIAGTSREALAELRRLLAVLRPVQHDDTYNPAPGLDVLDELTERVGADLQITGTPRSLPPGLELCAYRVIQEALTNAIKHAHPARAQVTVDYRPIELVVRVINGGPVVHRKVEASGHGLIGMRERARLYNGVVHAGYRTTGGFEVKLTLPIPEQT